MDYFNIICSLIVALGVGVLFKKLKIKGGLLIGAIVGVAFFYVAFGMAQAPPYSKFVAQTIAGAFVGTSLKKEDIKHGPSIVLALIIMFAVYMLQNVVLQVVMVEYTNLDLPTILLSITPGGMSTIPLIAEDFGANSSYVAIMQFSRLTTTIVMYPVLIDRFCKKENVDKEDIKLPSKTVNKTNSIIGLSLAFVGGYAGLLLGFPAGVLVVSMLFVGVYSIFVDKVNLHPKIKSVEQILSGLYI